MKHTINIFLILALYFLTGINISAQQKKILREVISSTGGSANFDLNDKSVLIQQSIGQTNNIGTFSNEKTIVHEGFIQPHKTSFNLKSKLKSFKATCFPNPFFNELNIEFEDLVQSDITIKLFDLSGRVIEQSSHMETQKLTLDYSTIEPGFYLLTIQLGFSRTTLKIQKQ